MANDVFICPNTGEPCDSGICLVVFEVAQGNIKPDVIPEELTSHADYMEKCRECPVFKSIT